MYLPITDWYAQIGKTVLEQPSRTNIQLLRYMKEKFGYNYLNRLVKYIQAVENFIVVLEEGRALSMMEFLSIANEASVEIRRASGMQIPYEWCSRSEPGREYLPASVFTVTEIIVEAGARLKERSLLSQAKNGKELVREWEASAVHGVYAPAYTWLLENLGDLDAAYLAVDLSLMTPIDLSMAPLVDGKLYVEDCHPGWRLRRITGNARRVLACGKC